MEDLSIHSQGYEEIEEESTPHRPRNPFGTTRKDKDLGLENYPRGKAHKALKSSFGQDENATLLANQTYNVFFRVIKIMEMYRIEYALSLLRNKVPITAQAIIIKDFNPYFAMGFLRPNMSVTYYITKRYKFNKPFSDYFNKISYQHFLNLIPAFTLKAALVKKLVKKNHTIAPRDLYVTEKQVQSSGIKVVKQEDISLREMLKTYGKAPVLMLDASMIGYDIGIHRKKNDYSNIWTFGNFDFRIMEQKETSKSVSVKTVQKEEVKKNQSVIKKKPKPKKPPVEQVINIEEAFSVSSDSNE